MTEVSRLSSKRRFLRDFWEGPIPSVEEELLRMIENGTILDFGCGKGAGMKRFRERRWETIGFDPESSNLQIAKLFGHIVCSVGEWIPFVARAYLAQWVEDKIREDEERRKYQRILRMILLRKRSKKHYKTF
jgi:2-polyprenyl-3-methyl-5-hydroxy-6-metoxy-1,4-benzoquinol methylase